MPQIVSSLIINAPANHVHKTFIDFDSYSQWSSFLKSIKSKTNSYEQGAQLEVELEIKPGSITKFTPIVQANNPDEFRWVGTLGSSWIFEGSHKFEFKDLGNNKTEFVQSEEFVGSLKFPILWYVKSSTLQAFQRFNESLKKQSEQSFSD